MTEFTEFSNDIDLINRFIEEKTFCGLENSIVLNAMK